MRFKKNMFQKKRVSGKTIYLNSLLCNNIIIEKIEIQFFFENVTVTHI